MIFLDSCYFVHTDNITNSNRVFSLPLNENAFLSLTLVLSITNIHSLGTCTCSRFYSKSLTPVQKPALISRLQNNVQSSQRGEEMVNSVPNCILDPQNSTLSFDNISSLIKSPKSFTWLISLVHVLFVNIKIRAWRLWAWVNVLLYVVM